MALAYHSEREYLSRWGQESELGRGWLLQLAQRYSKVEGYLTALA